MTRTNHGRCVLKCIQRRTVVCTPTRLIMTGTGAAPAASSVDIMKRAPHDASVISLSPAEPHFLSTQRSINNKTRDIFQEKNFEAISQHLDKNVSEMTTSNIVTVLYLCGKMGHSLTSAQLQVIIDALQAKEDIFNIVDVSNSCFGLQSFHENDVRVLNLLTLLTRKIQESTESFNSQAVGNTLYGLKNLSNRTKEVNCRCHYLFEALYYHMNLTLWPPPLDICFVFCCSSRRAPCFWC
jgi:hypothetical protein